MKKSGVYKIVNTATNDFYIGGSIDINNRWKQHRYQLQKNKHHNKHLQNAWNKYGCDKFNFIIIEECICDKQTILTLEQRYIDNCNPAYNLSPTAGSCLGRKHTTETKIKLRVMFSGENNPNYGVKQTVETIEKRIEKLKGQKRSAEQKQKMSKAHKDIKLSTHHKKRIGEGHLGLKRSNETKQKMSLAQQGNNAKLCAGDVLKIRQLYANKIHTLKELSEIFNISLPTIKKIVYRKTWKHI